MVPLLSRHHVKVHGDQIWDISKKGKQFKYMTANPVNENSCNIPSGCSKPNSWNFCEHYQGPDSTWQCHHKWLLGITQHTLYFGYSHEIVNYSIIFVNKSAIAHTNTITQRHQKASLNTCCRNTGYILYPAQYTFGVKCKAENTVTLHKFLEILRHINFSQPDKDDGQECNTSYYKDMI